MKIKNKTNQIQEIELYDRDSRGKLKTFSLYLQSKGSTDIDPRLVSPRLLKLVEIGVIEVEDKKAPSIVVEEEPETPVNVEIEEESAEIESIQPNQEEPLTQTVETVTAEEETPGVFICPECGKEYASERGLTMHINKSHPNI